MSDAGAARRELDRLLAAEAADLSGTLPASFGAGVEAYVAMLLDENGRTNLTRIVEPEAVGRLHLLDALSALPLIDAIAPTTAVDLGSGGGVPGIVLALARPGLTWTLVDSVRKKADAMRRFVAELGLDNVEVVAERAESLGRDARHRAIHGLVTARACAALPVLVEYALPLLHHGGALIAWKGAITEDELRAGRSAAALLGGEVEVRATGVAVLGDHRFVVVHKVGATGDRFPRRVGGPARRPLG